jgi:D-Tyr-tRNA(Tyr) deacylase
MRAVVQRVARSAVSVVEGDAERATARIGPGLTVLIGVAAGDTQAEAQRLAEKSAGLRIFPRLSRLVVRRGVIVTTDVELPAVLIAQVADGVVSLRATAAELSAPQGSAAPAESRDCRAEECPMTGMLGGIAAAGVVVCVLAPRTAAHPSRGASA